MERKHTKNLGFFTEYNIFPASFLIIENQLIVPINCSN